MRNRVLLICCIEEQHAWFAIVMRLLDDQIENFTRPNGFPDFAVLWVDQVVGVVGFDGTHEGVRYSDADVEISYLTLIGFAGDKFADVGMINAQNSHIGASTASALCDLPKGLVVDAEKTDWPGCLAVAAVNNRALGTQIGECKTIAATRLLD